MFEIQPFVALALQCTQQEYPSHISHAMKGDEHVGAPRELFPAFFGCYDWHSAVHGHWLLARALRQGAVDDATRGAIRRALNRSLTTDNIAGEVAYLQPRHGFERPYGLAWLLQLHAELFAFDDPEARRFSQTLAPLVDVAVSHLSRWLPKLTHPIRSGTHSQTAFAMGLMLDWARDTGHTRFEDLCARRAVDLHLGDTAYAVHLEPSGEDFLSPALGAADLMRRVLAADHYASWLSRALPTQSLRCLAPVTVSDKRDGRLAHLDGLNLSRAWMLDGIASAITDDARKKELTRLAREHEQVGVAAVDGQHYAGAHWLGTFATYLVTRRGIAL